MARGRDGYVALKMENPYGGSFPDSGMTKVPFTSEGFAPDMEHGDSNNITSNPTKESTFVMKKWSNWALSGVANYTALDHLLYSILTGVTETAPVAAEAGTSSKIYAPSSTKRSFAAELSKGNIPSAKRFQFKGCVTGNLRLTFSDNGGLTYSASGMGLLESSTATTGSDPATGAVTPTTDPILGLHMTTRDIGTGADGDYCIRSGFIDFNQPLSNDDVCIGSASVGEIEIDGFLSVTGEFVIKFTGRAPYDDFLSQTELVSDLMFTSPNEIVAGGAATKRSLRIKLNKMKYRSPGGLVLIDTPGLLLARLPFEAEGISGTGVDQQPATVTLANEYAISSL